jgi:hypothetical protein
MLNAELDMIAEGLDPSTGSPITPGQELPDGQTMEALPEMPVMTVGGVPFGDPAGE